MSASSIKKPFLDPLEALDKLLSRFGHRGVVIGGIAVGLLSKTRFTEDLDAMVLLSVVGFYYCVTLYHKQTLIFR